MKLVREPDAGNPQVRFDERGAKTERLVCLSGTPARKGGNGTGSQDLDRHRVALRLYHRTRGQDCRNTLGINSLYDVTPATGDMGKTSKTLISAEGLLRGDLQRAEFNLIHHRRGWTGPIILMVV